MSSYSILSFYRQKRIFSGARIFKKNSFCLPLMLQTPDHPLVDTLSILPVLFWYVFPVFVQGIRWVIYKLFKCSPNLPGGILSRGWTPWKIGWGERPASQNSYPICNHNLGFWIPYLWLDPKSIPCFRHAFFLVSLFRQMLKLSLRAFPALSVLPIMMKKWVLLKNIPNSRLFMTQMAKKPYP